MKSDPHSGGGARPGRGGRTVRALSPPFANAIQPYGLVLIADLASHIVVGGAGEIEERLTPAWLGRPLAKLLAQDVDAAVAAAAGGPDTAVPLAAVPGRREAFDASLVISGAHILIDLAPRLERGESAAVGLARLEGFRLSLAEAPDLPAVCARASVAFRALTGFDRVMIYRVLADGTGIVVAEDRNPDRHPDLASFINHRFPAADIPRRARDISLRNLVRSIPDTDYVAAPIRGAGRGVDRIDLSASTLRSVDPAHIEYLKSMGVVASTMISIVRDGELWGTVTCHNATPRALDPDMRAVCRAFADELARAIGARHEADIHREQLRLRGAENALIARFDQEAPFDRFFADMGEPLRNFLGADGFAAVRGEELVRTAACPEPAELMELARWAHVRTTIEPLATDALAEHFPPADAYRAKACGMLAITLTTQASTLMMWFRAEEQETIDWAGRPRGEAEDESGGSVLFTEWRETVRGRARRWTVGEVDAATRLRRSLFAMRQSYRVRELSRTLAEATAERDYLRQEADRRVRDSLELLQLTLGRQAPDKGAAVALVQRCLGEPDQAGAIDLAGYIDGLIAEMRASMGDVARGAISLDLEPVPIAPDRAATIGLILAESIIGAHKRTGDAEPGPIAIDLAPHRGQFRLGITDQGAGDTATEGDVIDALARRLGGTIARHDARPGMRLILSAPLDRG